MRRDAMNAGPRLMAEFESADAMLQALHAIPPGTMRAIETYTPFEVPEVERLLGIPRPRLPVAVFVAGLVGAIVGYGLQWLTNAVLYPQNAGARPAHAAPSFIFITFETVILLSSLTAFFGVLVALRLPELWHPVFEIRGFERASHDRFWIELEVTGGVSRARDFLDEHGALRVVPLDGKR